MTNLSARVIAALKITLLFWAVLWGIQLLNMVLGYTFVDFGIKPRDLEGLFGVVIAPFIHASVPHALANTAVGTVLIFLLALSGVQELFRVSLWIILVGGIGTWLIGHTGVHVGSSILIYGWLGYLLARAWVQKSALSIIVAIVLATSYGGLVWGIFPSTAGVSWEGHLCGALGGILAAVYGNKGRTQGI